MGTDISGHIEVRTPDWDADLDLDPNPNPEHWLPAISLDLLYLGRNYDLFACLFGVRNLAGFTPIAADRGVPEDVSPHVRDRIGTISEFDAHNATWLTWSEVTAVDWSEPAATADSRIHEYRRTADGTLTPVGKAAWNARLEALIGTGRRPGDPPHRFPEGTEWTDGDTVFRVERMRRSDAVSPDGEWQVVWTVMRALASVHGADKVRLVVWFGS